MVVSPGFLSNRNMFNFCIEFLSNRNIFFSFPLQFPLYTLMVFDDWLNGVPVAYIVTSSSKQPDLEPWMRALAKKLASRQPDWAPNAFITDCAQAEINGLQTVWPGVKVFLCLWHVRRAWLKQAVVKIKDPAIRAGVLKGLGRIMYDGNCPPGDGMGPWAIRQLNALRDSFPIVDHFWAYFDKQWGDKTHMWVVGHRNLPYAGQDTNAAIIIESYHSNLKATLRASKGIVHGRRLDWVIYELTGEILSHYWYQAMRKQHGFVPNLKQEQFVINAVLKAREIPDSCVTLPIANNGPALVTSMNNANLYSVYSPECEWGCCDCMWALKGNICKHQIKVLMILHPELAEGTITRYCGSLAGTCEGGRANMLDHVVHFPDDCDDTGPSCTAAKGLHGVGARITPHVTGLETTVRNLAAELMAAAKGDTFLLEHLLADLHIVQGKQHTLMAQMKHGLVEPSQKEVHFTPNDDGSNMSLKRRKDFLDRQR